MEVTTIMNIEVTGIEKGTNLTLEDYSDEKRVETEKRIAEWLSDILEPSPDDIHVKLKTFMREEDK